MQKIDVLWKEYEVSQDKYIREKLITNYIPLVKHIVYRLHANLPPYLDYEDLISYGIFGLMQAIDRFDTRKKVKFETFAYPRIKGSIIDELRKSDWIPQSVRNKTKLLKQAHDFLEQSLGRSATDQELSQHLNISSDELNELYEQISVFDNIISFDEAIVMDSSKYKSPELHAEVEDIKNILSGAIDLLPDQEKLIVTLYYYEGLNFKEIAQAMDLSQGRISQLHSKAILRLRGRLARRKADL